MSPDLILDEQVRQQLEALAVDPPQGLLLTGLPGIGKRFVADSWAKLITGGEGGTILEPDEKGTISIDAVRELYRRTRGKRSERQVVVIDHAEAMGQDAQNALLKLLEEPNQQVTFVLTAPTAETLLPTIISRLQAVHLPQINRAWLEGYLKSNSKLDAQQVAQILFVANGRPASLVQLLNDPDLFKQQLATMQSAKQLLSGSAYERLAAITELSKDRPQAIATLEAMGQMIHTQLLRDHQAKLIDLAERLETCLKRLAQNGNLRAQLSSLFTE